MWCLFMYDTILSMNKRTLTTTDDSTIVYGSHTHSHAYLHVEEMTKEMEISKFTIVMYLCGLLRYEMSAVIQRLRCVSLQTAKHPKTQLSLPSDWGQERDFVKELRTRSLYLNVVKHVLDTSRKEKNKPEPMYKLEKQFRSNINDKSKNAPLASVNFILEYALFAKEFMTHKYLTDKTDMKGVAFMNDLMDKESQLKRRWQTMVYDNPNPPSGNPSITKTPAQQKKHVTTAATKADKTADVTTPKDPLPLPLPQQQ